MNKHCLVFVLLLSGFSALVPAAGCGVSESRDGGGDGPSPADAASMDGGDANLFWPDAQTPFMEKGLILPPNAIPCVDEDGGTTYHCNHHGSTVAELKDGTIAAVWYHGLGEKSHDSKIIWSRLAPGSKEWTWPETLYDDPVRAEGNPAIWVHESGEIFVFFVTIFGRDMWDDSYVRLVRSKDNGKTWSEPVNLRTDFCFMTRYHPARLAGGRLLLPLYNECLGIPVFIKSDDDFKTWEEVQLDMGTYFVEHIGQIQPSLIQRTDGKVMAITRDGTENRRIGRQISKDKGDSWTKTELTELPNSGTGVEQVKLLDGHIVVAFNNNPNDRFPLNAALSVDEGLTFTAAHRTLNSECPSGSCSYGYTSVTQSGHDGTLWVTYTHNRETIGWVHFNEAWLMQGHEPLNNGDN